MDARSWGARIFCGSLTLGAVLAACNNGSPPPPPPAVTDPCSGPSSFAGTWTASIKEPHASGSYTMKLKPDSVFDFVGTHVFDRDVTYDVSSPTFAGCRETGHFVGSWGYDKAKAGPFWIVLSPLSGMREGCADPGDNGPTYQGNTTDPDKSLVNGPFTLTPCALTISSTVFTKGDPPDPPDGGAGSGGGAGGNGGGGAGCDPGCYTDLSCFTDIVLPCVPDGMCTAGEQVIVADELVAPFCYENEVKIRVETLVANPFVSTIDAYKSGGAFCYHIDSTSSQSGDSTLVYKDMSDSVLATVETSGSTVTITCAGMPAVTLTGACGGCSPPGAPGGGDCAVGACTAP